MFLSARKEEGCAVPEFVTASGDDNVEDRIALLGNGLTGTPAEREISLRPLRRLASSVGHERSHEAEFMTVRVEAPD